MPHSNGRVYTEPNVDSTKPDWGADLTGDVAAVLGVNSGDTATLCSHANINKWATFKPIKSASIKPLTKRMRHDAAYGLKVLNRDTDTVNGVLTLMAACDGIYQRSQGFTDYLDDLVCYDKIPLVSAGVVSPNAYRIDDFAFPLKNGIGYNHNAKMRASYKDGSSNWHGIEIKYSGRGENNQGIGIENPGGNEELVNDWTNYSQASFDIVTDSNITTVHESILVQDLVSGFYHNYSGLSGWNIGIIFTGGEAESTFIWVGGINWSNTNFTNSLASFNMPGSCMSVMMFFTDKPIRTSGNDYDYYTNDQFNNGNPNWIAIPKSYADIYLKSAVDGRVFSAFLGGNGAIPPGLTISTWYYDLSACIRNINWSNMGLDAHDDKGYYVELVLGEYSTSANPVSGTSIKVYQSEYTNGTEIRFSAANGTPAYIGSSQNANQLHDSSLMGQTMYLNFVGKDTSGNRGVIWSEEVELDYKSEYIEQ